MSVLYKSEDFESGQKCKISKHGITREIHKEKSLNPPSISIFKMSYKRTNKEKYRKVGRKTSETDSIKCKISSKISRGKKDSTK